MRDIFWGRGVNGGTNGRSPRHGSLMGGTNVVAKGRDLEERHALSEEAVIGLKIVELETLRRILPSGGRMRADVALLGGLACITVETYHSKFALPRKAVAGTKKQVPCCVQTLMRVRRWWYFKFKWTLHDGRHKIYCNMDFQLKMASLCISRGHMCVGRRI